jgi:hypothetical protein
MTIRTIYRSGKYPPVQKALLYLTLVGVVVIVFLPIAWMYQKMKLGMGVNIAQITLTFAMVIFLGLIMTGMGLAYFIDNAILRRKFIFRTSQPGGWVDVLVRAWGFDLIDEQPEILEISAPGLTLEADEDLEILNKPRKRGRKPLYLIDRWRRVVLTWEKRDTLRDSMTLIDLLIAEFGTHADGSPGMSRQSYYDWRDKVIVEFNKKPKQKK